MAGEKDQSRARAAAGEFGRSRGNSKTGRRTFYWSRHALPFMLPTWAADLIARRFVGTLYPARAAQCYVGRERESRENSKAMVIDSGCAACADAGLFRCGRR